jgi:N-acetylglutamate synthase-like GNAT family acetyltransferase
LREARWIFDPGLRFAPISIECSKHMIRLCTDNDFHAIFEIVNDAAQAYKGVIPDDRWHEPYMTQDHLCHELASGVVFWGYEEDGELLGIMGIQDVQDVTLIRHAYVRTKYRSTGIGGKLISRLKTLAARPTLVGTWRAAAWAIRFYEQHGFKLVSHEEKERLLRKYWSIPERQTETAVVLADERAIAMLRKQP